MSRLIDMVNPGMQRRSLQHFPSRDQPWYGKAHLCDTYGEHPAIAHVDLGGVSTHPAGTMLRQVVDSHVPLFTDTRDALWKVLHRCHLYVNTVLPRPNHH